MKASVLWIVLLLDAVRIDAFSQIMAAESSCFVSSRGMPGVSLQLRQPKSGVSMASVPMTRKTFLLVPLGLATSLEFCPVRTFATPVRAPLPFGPADPKDKSKLETAAGLLNGMEAKLANVENWPGLIEIVTKEPFTKDSMDEMFRYAARCLPPNALLGTDAGQWVGLKTEAVDAMDAFSGELAAKAKGEKNIDTADLFTYYETAKSKTKEFLALYDNRIESKVLPGFRPKS